MILCTYILYLKTIGYYIYFIIIGYKNHNLISNPKKFHLNSEAFEMSEFYKETTAVFEAKKTSLETKQQDEDDQMEDPDIIKMAVRFDK